MTQYDEVFERGRKALIGGSSDPGSRINISHAKGSKVWTVDGKEYLDCTAQSWSLSLGHANDEVNQAVIEQIQLGSHFRTSVDTPVKLITTDMIAQITAPCLRDGAGGVQISYAMSGSDAVEGAVKLALRTQRAKTGHNLAAIAVVENGYHGGTLATLNMTWPIPDNIFSAWAGPIVRLPVYDRYLSGVELRADIVRTLEVWQRLLDMSPVPVAALFIEPVQGNGGMYDFRYQFLAEVRDLCTSRGILLVFDEIQTGFGRVGAWYQAARMDVHPDIMLFGKGVANGYPLFGTVSTKQHVLPFATGDHRFTYGHNPVSMAAARATINVLRQSNLIERVANKGAEVSKEIQRIVDKYPGAVREVRGPGYMIGIEFAEFPSMFVGRAQRTAHQVVVNAREMGVLLGESKFGMLGNVVKWKPAFVITDAEIEFSLQVLDRSIAKALEEVQA